MAIEIESFPHGGEHLDNDRRIARTTIWLLAVFVVAVASFLFVWLHAR